MSQQLCLNSVSSTLILLLTHAQPIAYGGGSDNYSGGMDAMTGNNYGGGGFMDDVGSSGNKAVEKKVELHNNGRS